MRKQFSDMTTQELIDFYVYLNKHWEDEESKALASRKIKATLAKRFKATIDMLDDWQVKDNPEGLFRNILLGIY